MRRAVAGPDSALGYSNAISNYGLQLNYGNSQSPNALFFMEPGVSRQSPDVIYINNVKFVRAR